MIKTVKVKKQLRLDELIKYVWENGTNNEDCYSDLGNHVSIGAHLLWTNSTIGKTDTFTVEVEEEITQETLLQDVVIIVLNGIKHMPPTVYHSIRSIRRDYPTVTEIHTLINGKLELIWEAE